MMEWKDFIPPVFSKKATEIHRAIVRYMGINPQWSKRDYDNFAKEGYNANVWVYRCVDAVAKGVAGVDWNLYQKGGKQLKEIENHELLNLLDKPNELMSKAEFFEAFAAYALIAGNSYMHMNGPTKNGQPRELWVLRPDRMKIIPHSTDFIAKYLHTVGDQKVYLERNVVSHMKFFNPIDDLYGLSPIEVSARGIDNDNAANAWNNSLLNNSGRPSGALVTDEALTEAQYNNIKANIDASRGAKNAGKPLLLEGGLKWQEMSLSPRDMDFISTKKMGILEICAAFGVPPEIVGYGENKTYSNYEEARKALYVDAVMPLLDKIRDKLNADLVSKFGDNLMLDYDRDSIEALQENSNEEAARIRDDYQKGVISMNEAREARGYKPVTGGDVFLIPGTMLVVDEAMNIVVEPKPVTPAPTNTEPKPDDGNKKSFFLTIKGFDLETEEQKTMYWKAIESGREKYYSAVSKKIKETFKNEQKAVIAGLKANGEKGALKAIDKGKSDWEKLFAALYVEVMDEFGTNLFDNFKKNAGYDMETKAPLIPITRIFNVFDKAVQAFIATTVAQKVVQVTNTTKDMIKNIIGVAEHAGESIEQIATKIDSLYLDQIIPNRSEVIARTEVIGASNAGNSHAADQTGLDLNKEWLATRDDRTRDTHNTIDGEIVPKSEPYSNGLMYPGDPKGTAAEIIQCRCTEVYKVNEHGKIELEI